MTDLEVGLSEHKIPALDGLRAIAVFLVVFYHFGIDYVPGGLGVMVFFVISGFLITWLMLKEYERHETVSLKKFYARRALRIFPAFYAYAILDFVVVLILKNKMNWPQAISALLYVSNYYQAFVGDPGTGFSHTWSLANEEQFYLIWPPLFLVLAPRGKTLWAIPAVLIVAAWIYRAVLQFVFHVWEGYFYEAFDTRFDHLLVGCLLGIFIYKTRGHPGWSILSSAKWLPLLTVVLMFISVWLEFRYTTAYRDSIGFIVNPLLVATLIPQLIALRGLWFASWLEFAPVRYLGKISYSLYLYQQLVLHPVRHALSRFPAAVQLIGALVVLVLVSGASFRFIETPFLRWKDRSFHV